MSVVLFSFKQSSNLKSYLLSNTVQMDILPSVMASSWDHRPEVTQTNTAPRFQVSPALLYSAKHWGENLIGQ